MRALIRFAGALPGVRPGRVLGAAVGAGLANAAIIGILDAAAGAPREASGSLRVAFLLALVLYWFMQRRLFTDTTRGIETALHRYRLDQVERLGRSDLDAVEALGPATLYGTLTRQVQVMSTAAGPIVLAGQALVIIACVVLLFAWLSPPGAALTLLVLGGGLLVARRRWGRAWALMQEATAREHDLFDAVTDHVAGFKEVRLNRARGRDLDEFTTAVSTSVTTGKIGVDALLIRLFLFTQTGFYAVAAALILLAPAVSPGPGRAGLQAVAVILFLVGPVSAVMGASSAVIRAAAAAEELARLEAALGPAAGKPAPAASPLTAFSEIRLEGVTYRHRREDGEPGFALGPVSLTLRRGELVFIRGGNGSGKTTLLRVLTALYAPRTGALSVDGRPVEGPGREGYRQLFSAVFADFHLFHRPFGLESVPPERVDELLGQMGLAGKTRLADGRFTTVDLSTGQRKRLALIAALLEDRPVYVFDEWAADQDPEFRRRFYHEILPTLHARGKTIVAVSHDERYVGGGDRLLSMEEGRLIEDGADRR